MTKTTAVICIRNGNVWTMDVLKETKTLVTVQTVEGPRRFRKVDGQGVGIAKGKYNLFAGSYN